MERLLSLPSLFILFVLSFLLTAEEAIHLVRSHPNLMSYYGMYSRGDRSACTPLNPAKDVLECPTLGYNSIILVCTPLACGPKEPSTGLTIDPTEAKRLRGD